MKGILSDSIKIKINDCNSLQSLGNNEWKNNPRTLIELSEDIDCSSLPFFKTIGNESNIFKGTFNGKGKRIKNLSLSINNRIKGGIFIYGIKNAIIRDLVFENVKIFSNTTKTIADKFNDMVSLFGRSEKSTLKNVQLKFEVGKRIDGTQMNGRFIGITNNRSPIEDIQLDINFNASAKFSSQGTIGWIPIISSKAESLFSGDPSKKERIHFFFQPTKNGHILNFLDKVVEDEKIFSN